MMSDLKHNQELLLGIDRTVSAKPIPRWSAARKRGEVLLDRRNALLACACSSLLCMAGPVASQSAPRIVFLNPGEPVERGTGPYWRMVAQFMTAAARIFGMHLEILWAERDHLPRAAILQHDIRRPVAVQIGCADDIPRGDLALEKHPLSEDRRPRRASQQPVGHGSVR